MITVSYLISLLKDLDQNAQVVIQDADTDWYLLLDTVSVLTHKRSFVILKSDGYNDEIDIDE